MFSHLAGKWHLGMHSDYTGDYSHHPTSHGFDYFFGTPISNHRGLGPDDTIVWLVFPTLKRNLVLAALFGVLAGWFLYKKVGVVPGVLIGGLGVLIPAWMAILFTNTHILNSGYWRNTDLVEQPINFDRMSLRLVNEGLRFLQDRKDDRKPYLLMMSWLQVHTFLHATDPFKGTCFILIVTYA